MTGERLRRWLPRTALGIMAIAGAVLYFCGDRRNGLMTGGETLFMSSLVYSAAQRRRARESAGQ
jgi:hypothetical protein